MAANEVNKCVKHITATAEYVGNFTVHVNLNTTDSCANTLLHGVTHVSVYAYKDIRGKRMQAECLSKIVSPGLLHSCDHAPSAQL